MNWLARLLRRRQLEDELERELADHIQRRVGDLTREGVEPLEAARRAHLEFGTADEVKEACRDVRGARWLEDAIKDYRFGMRVLWKSPVFTTVAVLSLALGIGANTAIFTLMDRLMLRRLPVQEASQLVEIGPCCLSYPVFDAIQRDISGLAAVLAEFPLGPMDILIDGKPEVADMELVSGSYYSVLGVHATLGQTFTAELDRKPTPVAVISHRYWERRFDADPSVIGKTFRRVDTLFTIIGVTPPEFTGVRVGADPDIAIPLAMDGDVRGGKSWRDDPGTSWLAIIGRLRPGVGREQIRAELNARLGRGAAISPLDVLTHFNWEVKAAPTGLEGRRAIYREPLEILFGAVALILLLACTNLTNLLLSKSATRNREISIRLAVGAARGRVVRQLLTEALLIGVAGGIVGVLFAYGFAEYLLMFISNGGPRLLLDVRPDLRVLAFALAASIIACVLFGLAPAIVSTRSALQPSLGEAAGTRWRIGKGLLITQMAISVVLLIVAGIFVRSLINIYRVDSGLNPHNVILFSSNVTTLGYAGLGFSAGRAQQEETAILSELSKLLMVESVTLAKHPPISRGSWRVPIIVEGHEPDDLEPHLNSVGPDFFKTLGTPVLMGREFDTHDADDSPRVAVVNEAFARYYFGGQPPLGKWLAIASEKDTHYQIVGVVKDVKYESLRADYPMTVYFTAAQVPPGDSLTFAVRTTANISGVGPAIQKVLTNVDPMLRVQDMHTLEEHVERSLFEERILATLAGFFGALALLLGAIGIYGVMAYNVSRRRREIGIRMALGANRGDVVRLVVGQILVVTIVGSVIGATASLELTRVAKGILYGIQPNDPATFATAIAVLLAVAVAAAYVPGRRASRTNPVDTLRFD